MEGVSQRALKPGTRLHWYQIEKVLGQGGFGITYLARDGNLGRFVAIKEYAPLELAARGSNLSVEPNMEDHKDLYFRGLDRFISEARTLSKFKHPNIVSVLAVFEINNTAYMVMQYEKGESLSHVLRRFGTLSEAEIIRHFLPLLDGLQNVHEAGFIHRDIKPANIFTRKGGVSSVLLDFGSARHGLGRETHTLTSLVSPGYSPYEQYYSSGEEQGPWTDIYAAGATLYHTVVGHAPRDAIERGKGLLGSAKDLLEPATEAGKGRYSREFLAAIDHALMFNREDRPQSVNDWLQDFQQSSSLTRPSRISGPAGGGDSPGTQEMSGVMTAAAPATATSEDVTAVPILPAPGPRRGRLVFVAFALFLAAGFAKWYAMQGGSPADGEVPVSEKPSAGLAMDRVSGERKALQDLLGELKVETNRLVELRQAAESQTGTLTAGRNEIAALEQTRREQEVRLKAIEERLDKSMEDAERQVSDTGDPGEKGIPLEEFRREIAAIKQEGAPPAPDSAAVAMPEAQPRTMPASSAVRETPVPMDAAPDPTGADVTPVEASATMPDDRDPLPDGLAAFEAGNYAEALHILKPLAENGLPEAQTRMAAMYASGRGVDQDLKQAAAWYQKSADQGDGDAQRSLAGMYEAGAGVSRSTMMAYVWYALAASQGDADAVDNRSRLAAGLQPVELEQADRLIAAKLEKIGQDDRIRRTNAE